MADEDLKEEVKHRFTQALAEAGMHLILDENDADFCRRAFQLEWTAYLSELDQTYGKEIVDQVLVEQDLQRIYVR